MSFDPIANGWRKLLKRSTKEKTITVNAYDADDWSTLVPIEGRLNLVAGQTYTLSIPDIPEVPAIECKCVDMSGGAGLAFALGNLAIFDSDEGEDTGEFYVVMEGYSDGKWMYFAISKLGAHSLSITCTETVHTIEPKYIPNYMPMVDISEETFIASMSDETDVTADEAAALDEAAKTKMPLLLRAFVGGEVLMTSVLWYSYEGDVLYVGQAGGLEFDLFRIEDGWRLEIKAADNG